MTNIRDLFDLGEALQMNAAGYVRTQKHPDLPLAIANYTEKAQYEQVWNDVTLTCRGLIFDEQTGEVLARPYRKFFNYGDEANTGPLDLKAPAYVSDKLDGSLGISYPTPQGTAIATRGSFTSDQALHATELLATRYSDFKPPSHITFLFEIVYPQNRIVLDYGDLDDLILHGAIDIADGFFYALSSIRPYWSGPVADQFAYLTLAEALAAPPRPNAEGLVVRVMGDSPADYTMVKIKQDDYVALHRIVTNLNARTVWEWLGDGKTVGDMCATIPDDFHGWVEDIAAEITGTARTLVDEAYRVHDSIVKHLDEGTDGRWTRADYAHLAKENARLSKYLFLLLDGRAQQVNDLAWREVRPSGARSLVNHTEAVA